MKSARRNTHTRALHAWLELLRLPNLFTVPGDVLMGWALAGQRGGLPWLALLASLALYAAGLLWNDLFDLRIDAHERPRRPLPSGRVPYRHALAAALALSALGPLLALNAWPVAATLLALILFYDALAKRIAGLGVVTMGACRGANVLLGVAATLPDGPATWPPLAWFAAGMMMAYIIGVSIVARNEANPRAKVGRAWRAFPVAITLLFVPIGWLRGAHLLWAGPAACLPLLPLLLIRRPIPALVGGLIRHLILLQALWCLLATGALWPLPVCLLACALAAALSGRFFAGS
ncbi:MAG: UbiA family prenyltransferase [Candidatus Spyradenecus sp.]